MLASILPKHAAVSVARTAVAAVASEAAPRFMSIDAKAIRYHRHGDPSAVLKMETVSVDDNLAGNSVLVKMLAASISPSDLSEVRGFGAGSSFPAVCGNEGVGVVQKVGPSVKGLSKDDLVVPSRGGVGTWTTMTVAPEDALFRVGKVGDKAVSVEAAAALAAPCAAIRLIDGFASLSEGDVIIQNNAASTVGQAVIQYAASKGIKTINIMRHRSDWDDIVNHLQGLGAGLVVADTFAQSHEFKKLIADLPTPKLGLNSAGGDAATSVARALAPGATFVTFGNMSAKPLYLPLDVLVEKDITVRGFNLHHYLATSPDRDALLASAAGMLAGNKMSMLLAVEPFADFDAALKRATEAGERKVVFKM